MFNRSSKSTSRSKSPLSLEAEEARTMLTRPSGAAVEPVPPSGGAGDPQHVIVAGDAEHLQGSVHTTLIAPASEQVVTAPSRAYRTKRPRVPLTGGVRVEGEQVAAADSVYPFGSGRTVQEGELQGQDPDSAEAQGEPRESEEIDSDPSYVAEAPPRGGRTASRQSDLNQDPVPPLSSGLYT
jgi:hypothetical protein